MRNVIIIGVSVVLTACGASYKVDPAQISAISAGAQPSKDVITRMAESQISARLKDPESARFEWPNVFVAGAHQPLMEKPIYGWITCGTVNAKNSYGGYTGAQAILMVVRDGQIVFVDMDSPAAGRPLNAGYCRLYGVPV